MGQRYRKLEDQKPRPRVLTLNQNFAKGRGLKPKVKQPKCSQRGRRVEKSGATQESIPDRGLRAKPPAARRFFVIFGKKAILVPLNHILHVFKAI